MADIFDEIKDPEEDLRELGHTVVAIWEHEYDQTLKAGADFRIFCLGITPTKPANPRDSFMEVEQMLSSCIANVNWEKKFGTLISAGSVCELTLCRSSI